MHIESELARISKKLLTPTLTATLLTACRQELEETSQEYIQLDYQAGKHALSKLLTEAQQGSWRRPRGSPDSVWSTFSSSATPGDSLLFPSILWAAPR